MNLALWVSVLGLVAMSSVLVYVFRVGHFTQEGSQLLKMPWDIISMVELYTGRII